MPGVAFLLLCVVVGAADGVGWFQGLRDRIERRRLGTDKDYNIYGGFYYRRNRVNSNSADEIIDKGCFTGFGFKQCTNVGPYPDLGFEFDEGGNGFCLKCCNNQREDRWFKETWNLNCINDKRGVLDGSCKTPPYKCNSQEAYDTNKFMYEARFARRNFLGDKTVKKCRMNRRPDVQEIKFTTTEPISFKYRLGYTADADGRLGLNEYGRNNTYWTKNISNLAVGEAWEELVLREDEGIGRFQSLEYKLNTALNYAVGNLTNRTYVFPALTPLSVTHVGPDFLGSHTWRVTFPTQISGWYQGNIPLFKPEVISANISNDKYSLTVKKVEDTKLHGYQLRMEVIEHHETGLMGGFWREVIGCDINVTERLGVPKYVMQSVTMQRASASSVRLQWGAFLYAASVALLVARGGGGGGGSG